MRKAKIYLLTLMLVAMTVVRWPASAEVVLNERVLTEAVGTNACTGEQVAITVECHYLVHRTVNKDGTVHTEVHGNCNGTGLGLVSGKEYIFNDNFRQSIDNPLGCEVETQAIEYVRVVSKGDNDNLAVRFTTRFLRDASCHVVYNIEFEDLECKG
jgi:hypothetical protein